MNPLSKSSGEIATGEFGLVVIKSPYLPFGGGGGGDTGFGAGAGAGLGAGAGTCPRPSFWEALTAVGGGTCPPRSIPCQFPPTDPGGVNDGCDVVPNSCVKCFFSIASLTFRCQLAGAFEAVGALLVAPD